jgi:dTDP-4-amino-4,6-dideoxygalactose transaminase
LQEAARATHSGIRLPETEKAAREVLTLPCYPELESREVAAVAGALRALAQEAHVG